MSSLSGCGSSPHESGWSLFPLPPWEYGGHRQLRLQNSVHEPHFTTIWFSYNEIMYIYKYKIYVFQFWLAHKRRKSASYYLISSDIRTVIFLHISNTKQHLKPYSDTATFKSSWLTLKKKKTQALLFLYHRIPSYWHDVLRYILLYICDIYVYIIFMCVCVCTCSIYVHIDTHIYVCILILTFQWIYYLRFLNLYF